MEDPNNKLNIVHDEINGKRHFPSKMCVRVRFNNEIKCIELDWDKIHAEHFTDQCKYSSFIESLKNGY